MRARKIKNTMAHLDVFSALKKDFMRRGHIPDRTRRDKKIDNSDIAEQVTEKTEQGPGQLVDLTVKAHDTLIQADTVFPFTLFPDTITLDREKLTIARRIFFRIAKVTSIPIADILSVEANVGLFFGSVHITSRFFAPQTVSSVNYLSREDATKIQRLLQGYIIAHERKVDCTDIDKAQLITLLSDLGQGATD